jgi:MoxR-like ATPase
MTAAAVPGIDPQVHQLTEQFRSDYRAVQSEIAKAIVGHHEIVDGVLTCLFVGGHALLEGVPGLGKTALIRALAQALNLKFSRIQFTPDLMPADVIGTNVIMEDEHGRRNFQFVTGPIFSQIVLADEINRATPKTQSALLEAMQERQVTSGGAVRKLEEPFFVMATQNPLEQEGTYPLPEAQLDRFFYKLLVRYSNRAELATILDKTTTGFQSDIQPILDGPRILRHQQLVRRVGRPARARLRHPLHAGDPPAGPVRHADGQPVPARGGEPPRRPGDRAGGEGAGPAGRPVPRELQGRQGSRHPRDAPPRHPQLRGRGRGHHHRHGAGEADQRRPDHNRGGASRRRGGRRAGG